MNKNEERSSNWLYGGALLSVLLIAGLGLYILLSMYFSHGELGTKAYYAVLQAIDIDSINTHSEKPIYIRNANGSDLNVLGLISRGSTHRRVWVILNQASPDGAPLMMPSGVPVDVDCGFVTDLVSKQRVVASVQAYLFKSCSRR